MAAISDLKSTLEPKLDTVMVDVSLLRADLQKMADKMSIAESDIQTLRSTSKSLEEQVRTLTAQRATMWTRLEDQEGSARQSNIRVVGVPEAKGILLRRCCAVPSVAAAAWRVYQGRVYQGRVYRGHVYRGRPKPGSVHS
ncbi:hypothetical protein NDU88_008165 [Pleurodeles waltl]|uniref:Uncharacterized protein n=1 Tax=Pleurodeles waltl TaxID=8319 RepID=A0AAV7SUJ8_PLEWA|nr:hypothetical protein NDU88_008165 [Pleurodeles waltl]